MRSESSPRRSGAIAILLLVVVYASCRAAPAQGTVSVVTDPSPGPAASHGLKKLTAAMDARQIEVQRAASPESATGQIVIVAGLAAGSGPAAKLSNALKVPAPPGPEALAIRHTRLGGKRALLVAGYDDRGLMYALLDVADRVGWADDPDDFLEHVRNASETPFVPDRALSIYTMHKACFESRFFNENYWVRYLDMLAQNRFNRFVLIFGYENAGYFAPPYPFFFDVEEFPDVRVVGLTEREQQRNLKALNRLIEMAAASTSR